MTLGQPDSVDIGRPSGPQGQDTPAYEEQKVSWLELFFDLIFVVAFDQLAKRLGHAPDGAGMLHFGLLFVAVWWAWADNATFAARYGNESRTYRWGTLAQLVSLAMIALTLRGDLSDTGGAFALAYAVNRLIQAGMYLSIARRGTHSAPFARRMALSFVAAAALWLASAAWPGGSGVQIGLWCAALLLDVLTPLLVRTHSREALPHEGHLPERVGLLQIIALGAVVTEIVGGSRQQELTAANLVPALAAIVTAVALWRLYFDQARSLPLLGARVERHMQGMLAWLYGHLPFTLAVVVLGVGLGHGLSAAGSAESAGDQRTVGAALALALLTLAFLRWNSLRSTGRFFADRTLPTLLLGAGLAAGLLAIDLDTLRTHLAVAALTTLAALISATDPVTRRLGQLEEKVLEQLEDGEEPASVADALDQPPAAPTSDTSP